MKNLKLTSLAKDEIKKKELKNICGGNVEAGCTCNSTCGELSGKVRRTERRIDRRN